MSWSRIAYPHTILLGRLRLHQLQTQGPSLRLSLRYRLHRQARPQHATNLHAGHLCLNDENLRDHICLVGRLVRASVEIDDKPSLLQRQMSKSILLELASIPQENTSTLRPPEVYPSGRFAEPSKPGGVISPGRNQFEVATCFNLPYFKSCTSFTYSSHLVLAHRSTHIYDTRLSHCLGHSRPIIISSAYIRH